MKQLALGLCAAVSLLASSGCCCFWHNVHSALHCGHGYGACGGGCGGNCGQVGCVESAPCEGCGSHNCGGCCQSSGHGCREKFTLLGAFFGYHRGCDGCSIFGCGSHYLDPQGACYGSDCGTCCEKSGCGCMYWGDYWNVPPTYDPCDCCQNYVGPYHYGGSTPCYYGPVPAHQGPHPAAGVAAVEHEGVVVAEKTTTAPSAKTASRPASGTVKK